MAIIKQLNELTVDEVWLNNTSGVCISITSDTFEL